MWMPIIVLAVEMMCPEGTRGSARESVASSSVTITEQGDFLHVEFVAGATVWDLAEASKPYLRIHTLEPGETVPVVPWCDPEVADKALGVCGRRMVHAGELLPFFRSLVGSVGLLVTAYGRDGPDPYLRVHTPIEEGRFRCFYRPSAPVLRPCDLPAYSTDAGLIVTTSMSLKSAHPQEVVNRLQPTFSDPMISSIRAVMQSRAIVVTGEAPQVCRAVEAVKLLDAAASAPDLIWECTTSVFR